MQKQIFAHKRDSPELAVYLCQILSDPPDSWAVQILTPLPTWERLALLAWRSSGERCRPSYRMHPKIDDVIECFEMWKLIFKATIKYSIYKVKAKSKARWRLGKDTVSFLYYLAFPFTVESLDVIQQLPEFAVETLVFLQRCLLIRPWWNKLELPAPRDVTWIEKTYIG